MKVKHRFRTGGPISAAATVAAATFADLNGDGRPIIVAGSDALYAWRAEDGKLLPGFPVRGGNFFASQPLVADLRGDGRQAIIAGCDDNSLYGFDARGRLLPGFPIPTGGDIYSSPAAADLDGDGALEIVAGSDDGNVYIWRAGGTPLPGWPQSTGGFVSASPVIADLDGDGRAEIITGSWDRHVHAWRIDGSRLPGWPQETGHFVWSTPRPADLPGDGRLELIAASDRVYVWRADGSPLPGWPQPTAGYVVGRPLVADLNGDGRMDILVAADRLYAWSVDGTPLPGFPLDLDTYFWSSPLLAGTNRPGRPVIYLCGWDGCLHAIKIGNGNGNSHGHGHNIAPFRLSDEPIFATPTLINLNGNGDGLLVGAWDGTLYLVELGAQNPESPRPPGKGAQVRPASTLTTVTEAVPPFVTFPGPATSQAAMYYRADFETDWHPVPLLYHRHRLTGLIQPFPAGTTVSLWADINGHRVPAEGVYSYRVRPDPMGRLRRRVRKWAAER